MIYRMLAMNVDGTLLTKSGRIHKSTREALTYVQEKGIDVTLVTSRNFSSARRIATALQLASPIVTNQGAYIVSANEKPLHIQRIGEGVAIELVRVLEAFPCHIRLVHENYVIANKYKWDRRFIGKIRLSENDFSPDVEQIVPLLSESLMNNPLNPLNIKVYFANEADVKDVVQAFQNMYDTIKIVRQTDLSIEISAKNATKLFGLTYVREHFGYANKELVVIGNSEDDIPMIERAGLGVAMGNAPFAVKHAADWVTRSNNEHGVAYMVREHFRKQQPIEFLRKMNIIK